MVCSLKIQPVDIHVISFMSVSYACHQLCLISKSRIPVSLFICFFVGWFNFTALGFCLRAGRVIAWLSSLGKKNCFLSTFSIDSSRFSFMITFTVESPILAQFWGSVVGMGFLLGFPQEFLADTHMRLGFSFLCLSRFAASQMF